MSAKNLIVIIGPTAVGKTALAVALARHYATEIVSGDSRQVYRELVVGTAKPSDAERAAVVHHLVDSHSIHDALDAARYGATARDLLATLFQQHDTVIVCGGSGLYVQALLEGFDEMPPVPASVRKSIVTGYAQLGLPWLQREVRTLDPVFFDKTDQRNPHRLMRALELLRVAGLPIDQLRTKKISSLPYHVIKIGLELPRQELYERINRRVDEMMSRGLWQEAETLFPFRNLPPLQTVGYQEIFDALAGEMDRQAAVERIKRNTRRYAKRQLTWFKRDAAVHWFHPGKQGEIFRWMQSQLR